MFIVVVKAKAVQPFLQEVQIKVIEIYKDGAFTNGEVISVAKE